MPGALFGLYCYFIVDYFLHLPARIPGYGSLRPTLVVAALIALFLLSQVDKFREITRDERVRALVILLGYVALSLPLVEWPGSVIRDNASDFVKAVLFLFFTAFIVDTDRRLKIFLLLFVGLQVFRVLEPLYLHLTEGYMGSETYLGGGQFAGRLSGAPADVINPNGLGFVISTCVPFLHYLLWGSRSKLAKLLYLALLPALLYALILSMSRGGFIALLVVGFFIFRQSSHKLFLVLAALGIAAVGWGVMSDVQKDRYLSLVSSDTTFSGTVEGRFEGMMQEFRLGLERPLVGHGVGTTSEAKFNVYGYTQAAHNLYAQLLIEIGFIGFVLFLRYLRSIHRLLRANLERLKELSRVGRTLAFHYRLDQALLATFWMFAVYSFNYFGLSQYYWYLFGGLCIAFARSLERNWPAQGTGEEEHGSGNDTERTA